MQVQYFELNKVWEGNGDVWKHVAWEVELDEIGAFGYCRKLRGLDVGPCQDQKLQSWWVLDELADLKLLLLLVFWLLFFWFHLFSGSSEEF